MDPIVASSLKSGLSRMVASALTWPVEKSKLLYQRGHGIKGTVKAFNKVTVAHHMTGIVSSAAQRGTTTIVTFTIQGWIQENLKGQVGNAVVEHGIAGAVTGSFTAPFTAWLEPLKIRGEHMRSSRMFFRSMTPMILRNGVFEGVFFAMNKYLEDHHAGIRFAAASASASFMNLTFDVWKTRVIQRYPSRVPLIGVLRVMTAREFFGNYIIKCTEVCLNWFFAGCMLEYCFEK